MMKKAYFDRIQREILFFMVNCKNMLAIELSKLQVLENLNQVEFAQKFLIASAIFFVTNWN